MGSAYTRRPGSTISQPPAGQRAQRPKAASGRKSRASHRQPVTVTLQFMPGAEPWVRVTFEDRTWNQPATGPVFELVLNLVGWERSH